MSGKARDIGEAFFRQFQDRGARPVSLAVLQPAEALLDLYGENIRARAYVTRDPVRGEMMLRPDFTLPVALTHIESGEARGAYTYLGDVFRVQNPGADRASEYLQVGYELFGDEDTAKADAEIFSAISGALPGCTAVAGDLGLLIAAVKGLPTTERRRNALLRHIWRPARFRKLLERFSTPGDPDHIALLAGLGHDARAAMADAGPEIGLRTAEDVSERLAALNEEAETAPIPSDARQVLEALLELRSNLSNALEILEKLASGYEALQPGIAQFHARLDALESAGVETGSIAFEGAFGRSSMEYYDGFVFEFSNGSERVASGGRYDALTRALGSEVPAVGAVIRPGSLV